NRSQTTWAIAGSVVARTFRISAGAICFMQPDVMGNLCATRWPLGRKGSLLQCSEDVASPQAGATQRGGIKESLLTAGLPRSALHASCEQQLRDRAHGSERLPPRGRPTAFPDRRRHSASPSTAG